MLRGIQALVQVMQSEASGYLESDVLPASGVRFENNLADLNNMPETVIPDSDRVQRACNSFVSESYGRRRHASLPVQDGIIQQEKLVYTVLNSKNKFHSAMSNARSSGINEVSSNKSLRLNRVIPDALPNPNLTGLSELSNLTMNSTCPSATHKTPSSPNNAGPTLSAMSSSARSNPDPRITRPNEPLPACYLTTWKFQKILPKSSNANKNSPTRRKLQPANSMLYQLLKRSTPLTSESQQNPQRVSNTSKFPSTKLPPNSSSSTKPESCSTKSGTKARKRRKNRKSSTKLPVESFVSRESSSFDECLSGVKVHLAKEDLWKLFYNKGNETIVSKPGRYVHHIYA